MAISSPRLAIADSDLARAYLLRMSEESGVPRRQATALRDEILKTQSASQASQGVLLRKISTSQPLASLVNAQTIRRFLIDRGLDNLDVLDCLIGLATNLYSLNGRRLTSKLYEVALELKDLKCELEATIINEEKGDLLKVVRRKAIDLLDALPLVDETQPPGQRAVRASAWTPIRRVPWALFCEVVGPWAICASA